MATVTELSEPQTVIEEACPRPYRISVDLYVKMIETGVIRTKDPVYLWRGQLVQKMTKGHRHNLSCADLVAALIRTVPRGWFVRPEQPVQLEYDGMPEPDFSVARGSSRDFANRSVTAKDVALVAEVSDSSLAIDSGVMVEDYARELIPVYWIVNIPGRTIDVYTRPTGPSETPTYQEKRRYGIEDEVPVVLDGVEVGRIAVKDVLP